MTDGNWKHRSFLGLSTITGQKHGLQHPLGNDFPIGPPMHFCHSPLGIVPLLKTRRLRRITMRLHYVFTLGNLLVKVYGGDR